MGLVKTRRLAALQKQQGARTLDEAVPDAYGLPADADDAAIQTELMRRHEEVTSKERLS